MSAKDEDVGLEFDSRYESYDTGLLFGIAIVSTLSYSFLRSKIHGNSVDFAALWMMLHRVNTNEHRVVKFVETRSHEKLVILSFLLSFSPLLFSGRTSKEQIGPGQWGTRIDDGINGRSPLIRNSRLRFIWRLLFANFWQLPTTDPKQRTIALHCHIMIPLFLSLSLSPCFSVLILCPRFPSLLCVAFFVSFYLVPFLSVSFALIPLISFPQQDDSICSPFCITSRFPLNRAASSRRRGDRRSWTM